VLQCDAVRRSVIQCVKGLFGVLRQSALVKMLQSTCVCVCVCCSVLQCVAVCCSVLQCVAVRQWSVWCITPVSPGKDVAVSSGVSVLRCVAVCCSMLQYVAVCCSTSRVCVVYHASRPW